MNKRMQIMMGVLLLVIGVVITSIPLAMVVPKVQETAAYSLFDRLGLAGGYEQELKTGEYMTIVDEKSGRVVDKTARVVYVGDEVINESNRQYRVTRVRGNMAYSRMIGKASDITWKEEWGTVPADTGVEAAVGLGTTQIGIYHTHSDESYVPTDGVEAKPAMGGIFDVGTALASVLKSKGVSVIDDKTPHEPHDANAYHRSRKTAVKIMRKRPLALLDIHRDGVPDPSFYNKNVEGKKVTQVRLVVGRQNPNMATNLAFAKTVKAYMDKYKPGLIKGIYMGRGDYNQDLSPRALLLEVGTHTNDKYRAEKGASIFADAFPSILKITPAGVPGGGPGKTSPFGLSGREAGSAWKTIGWLIGIVLIGGAAFLFISTGSIKGMRSKVGELGKTEFASLFGLRKTNRKRSPKRNKQD